MVFLVIVALWVCFSLLVSSMVKKYNPPKNASDARVANFVILLGPISFFLVWVCAIAYAFYLLWGHYAKTK